MEKERERVSERLSFNMWFKRGPSSVWERQTGRQQSRSCSPSKQL